MRGSGGPRQPGGGRQIAGPRDHARGKGDARRPRPQPRPQPAAKRSQAGRPPLEARPRPAPAVEDARVPPAELPTAVQTVAVTADEAGMRVDRFLEARFPGLSFSHIQRIIRKGELRVNGRRAQPKQRLEAGQSVRVPPLRLDEPKPRPGSYAADEKTRD